MAYTTSYSCPVGSPTEATELIDQLLIQHKAAFKRKTAVGLYVSIQSAAVDSWAGGFDSRQPALGKLSHSVTIRPSDGTDATQLADALWLLAAAKAKRASADAGFPTSVTLS